jgi:hypothetical protein
MQRDLRELLNTMEGDVLRRRKRSTAGDEQWQCPRRGVIVPGEGLANMGERGVHEHRGSTRMLSPKSIG